MKKFLLTVMAAAMCLSSVAFAEEGGAYFKVGSFELTYPLSNASAISLYDFWTGQGLMGAETKLASFYNFSTSFGAVTSFEANGMPFVSVEYNFASIIPNYPVLLSKMGVWYGHDFKENENRAGIKADVPLW